MKTTLSNIKNIIFDLGGVILEIDYHRTAEALLNWVLKILRQYILKPNKHPCLTNMRRV